MIVDCGPGHRSNRGKRVEAIQWTVLECGLASRTEINKHKYLEAPANVPVPGATRGCGIGSCPACVTSDQARFVARPHATG